MKLIKLSFIQNLKLSNYSSHLPDLRCLPTRCKLTIIGTRTTVACYSVSFACCVPRCRYCRMQRRFCCRLHAITATTTSLPLACTRLSRFAMTLLPTMCMLLFVHDISPPMPFVVILPATIAHYDVVVATTCHPRLHWTTVLLVFSLPATPDLAVDDCMTVPPATDDKLSLLSLIKGLSNLFIN